MAKPTVFVSSTVHDLRDMRSAIQYWLEELGYDVLLNEAPNFPVAADLNSYDACIETVKKADYCIVLIGSRAGGWYDKDKGITITRAEYQAAYEQLCANGRPHILVFVREDVWTLFQVRHKTGGGDLAPVMDEKDAQPVFDFIEEARHAAEMKQVVAGTGPGPVYNWIHPFGGFGDVVTAIRTHFGIAGPVALEAMKANLAWELEGNLCQLGLKSNGGPVWGYEWASILDKLELSVEMLDQPVPLDEKHAKWLRIYCEASHGRQAISTTCLESAINSGLFLDSGQPGEGLAVNTVQQRLVELLKEANSLRSERAKESRRVFAQEYYAKDTTTMTFAAYHLASLHAVWQAESNVTELSLRLLSYLRTGDATHLSDFSLKNSTPLVGEQEKVDCERLTRDDIRAFLDTA